MRLRRFLSEFRMNTVFFLCSLLVSNQPTISSRYWFAISSNKQRRQKTKKNDLATFKWNFLLIAWITFQSLWTTFNLQNLPLLFGCVLVGAEAIGCCFCRWCCCFMAFCLPLHNEMNAIKTACIDMDVCVCVCAYYYYISFVLSL